MKDLFRIYRSSAGSGKTYHLTLEYLLLALRSPGYYRKILAVTFTNKATNEMKARIVANLHAIAHDRAPDELVERICRELTIGPPVLRERAEMTLRSILHGYSYYAVSTIDSFFQRIVTAFARDIGIQGGFSIEFDRDKVTDEIIDRMFLDLENDHLLRGWLTRYTGSRMEEEGRWDIRNELRDLAGQIYYEQFQEYLSVFGDRISDKKLLTGVLDKLKKERTIFKRKLRDYGREGLRFMDRHDLTVGDFSYGDRGPAGLIQKMALEIPFGMNSFTMKAYESKDSWYTKKSTNKSTIREALDGGLYSLYCEAVDYYLKNYRYQNTLSLVLKLFYNVGIYSNLIEKLVEYRAENSVILISDLARLIRTVIGENDAPFIYEKIGNYYNHYLIDEFQDTSGFQWNNFKPLVRNTVAQGNFNMVVGDVKQSIYRWRGGDWQILQQSVVDDIGKEYTGFEVLNNNWRSRENIVKFNNEIFRRVPGLLSELYSAEQPDDPGPGEPPVNLETYSLRFTDSYSDVLQHLPAERGNKTGGEISVRFFQSDGREVEEPRSWRDKVLDDLIPLINHIQDNNYQARQIAILVRSNREGKMVADHLLNYKRSVEETIPYTYDVISSESLFLYSSPAVNAVISFMKLVRNSKDPVARINMYYWLSVLKGRPEGITLAELYRHALDPEMEKNLITHLLDRDGLLHLKQFMALALDDLVEIISLMMGLGEYSQEQAYLMGLQNVILDYLSVHNGDINSFLDWWDTDGRKRSINPSEEQNAIQILTIHQAKGLEFEQVIIPFCSWNLDHKANSTVLWCPSGLESLRDLPYYPVKYEQSLRESWFADDYYNEKSLAYMDNVNLLYVALTRAVSGLYVYGELPKNTSSVSDAGGLLYKILENIPVEGEGKDAEIPNTGWDKENKSFQMGEMPTGKEDPATDEKFVQGKYNRGRWYNKIAIRKQPDVLSAGDRDEQIHYGVLMHDILSRIIHKDQAGRVLDEDMLSGKITEASRKKIEDMLNGLWQNKQLENWFTGDWEIKTEVPVLPGSGQISRMDRVMIKGDLAVVVDYKTGNPVSRDEDQVVRYKKILKEMGFKKVKGYLLYLEEGNLNSV